MIKKLKIPKGELARSLGIGPSQITNLLKGNSNPSETLIMLAGLKYSINEEWLRGIRGEKNQVEFTGNDKFLNHGHYINEILTILRDNPELTELAYKALNLLKDILRKNEFIAHPKRERINKKEEDEP